jgi:hypothetical protein
MFNEEAIDTPIIDEILADIKEIRRSLGIFAVPQNIWEVRILGAERQGTISGYYDPDHLDDAAVACGEFSGHAEGIYATLNPVRRDLLARASNRLREWARHTTSDADAVSRRWILTDFDAVRPAGISSTDTEHEAALGRANECEEWFRSLGFPASSLVFADSGNGAHLLVRVQMPNDDPSRDMVKRCLEAVAIRYTDHTVNVDLSTFNAARISKVYGTSACKGDSIPTRPHRIARLLEVPKNILPVKSELLGKLAAMAPAEPKPQSAVRNWQGHGDFDIRDWIAAHNLPVAAEKSWKGGTIWILAACPWNPDHTNRSACIIRHASGAIAARCHHDGCNGKNWHDLRDVVEPGWRERKSGGGAVQLPDGLSPAMAREYQRSLQHSRTNRRGR